MLGSNPSDRFRAGKAWDAALKVMAKEHAILA